MRAELALRRPPAHGAAGDDQVERDLHRFAAQDGVGLPGAGFRRAIVLDVVEAAAFSIASRSGAGEEERRVEREVGVGGKVGDRQDAGAGAQVDRLSAGDDDGGAVLAEGLQGVEQDPPAATYSGSGSAPRSRSPVGAR